MHSQKAANAWGTRLELRLAGEISAGEYWDREFTQHLKTAVRRQSESEPTGQEGNWDHQLIKEIIDAEIR